jgi:NAD(P)-dependent dehydrogenase (short-subunit alcohol dehydrogenase family)
MVKIIILRLRIMVIFRSHERGASMTRKRFEGKVALVTGAGSRRGIGRATALALAEEGAKVAITDIAAEGVQSVAAELNQIGPAFGAVADVRDKQAMVRVVERAVAEFGGLDILMNVAGITRPTPFLDTSEEEYDLVLDINLKGMFLTTQAAVPEMLARGGGAIVSLASVSGQRGGGIFGASAYSASKAGVMGLTKALARELSPRGIRVNCVAPSMIDTDITGAPLSEERKAALSAGVLLGRIGTVNDVVPCLLFLASDESAYLTGVTLDINGGMHMH